MTSAHARGSNRQDARFAKAGAEEVRGGELREPHAALDELARKVIGAAIEVHRQLGPGYLESVYEDALCIELELRSIRYERQVPLPVMYKGRALAEFRIDLVVDGELVVELKAVECFAPIHHSQIRAYQKAGCYQLGLLLNFNVPLMRDGICRSIWNE